ncbi:MAG: 50S ribosomal protein L6 [Candidatus Babeliaceae bacterium]
MSKIGRKPINLGAVQVNVSGNEISFSGKKDSGVFHLAPNFQAEIVDKKLFIKPIDRAHYDNATWGLQRALLANKFKGADTGFEKQLRVVGLGFKAVVSGNKVQLSLGKSHKIDYVLPQGVTLEVDKTGQLLTLRSTNKELMGLVGAQLKHFRPHEPYKGTGIHVVGEILIRKAGKTAKTA